MTAQNITAEEIRRRGRPDKVLRDGESLRVPLELCDHAYTCDAFANGVSPIGDARRSATDERRALHDGMGGAAGQRPGYVFGSQDGRTVADAEAVTAYHMHDQWLRDAWRTPPPRVVPPADAPRPIRDAGPRPLRDAAAARDASEKALAERDKQLQDAWRTPR